MIYVVFTIALVCGLGMVSCLVYALCTVSAGADDRAERAYREGCEPRVRARRLRGAERVGDCERGRAVR